MYLTGRGRAGARIGDGRGGDGQVRGGGVAVDGESGAQRWRIVECHVKYAVLVPARGAAVCAVCACVQ